MRPHSVTSASSTDLPASLRLVCATVVAIGLAVLGYGLLQETQTQPPLRHTYAAGQERANPWRGLPGCLRLTSSLTGQTAHWPLAHGMGLSCRDAPPLAADETPAQAKDIKTALYSLIQPPDNALPATDSIRDSHEIRVIGPGIAKSADQTLTLDPAAARIANRLADCLTTGNAAACQASRIDPSRFAHLEEGAAVRMMALVDMRIDTGAIENIASAHSQCFDRMVNPTRLPVRDTPQKCPQFPEQYTRNNAWRSGNHALTEEAMWGSLVKPGLALALLRGGAIRTPAEHSWLNQALKTSDTPAFISRVLCQSKGHPADCQPLAALHTASQDLGYANQSLDLLAGVDQRARLRVPTTHWLQRPPTSDMRPDTWLPVAVHMPEADLLKDCAKRDWSQCKGPHLAELTAHLWGQGDGKATALTAAATFARLAAAANEAHTIPLPSLRAVEPTQQPQHIEPRHAQAILRGMALTHTGPGGPTNVSHGKPGTAHSACIQVWGSAQACNQLNTLAGKTGTPTFPHDRFTQAERLQHCAAVGTRLAQAKSDGTVVGSHDKTENARCAYAPTKWYVALAKDSPLPGAPWTRVVAVQVERNWATNASGSKVDSALDKGMNMAAFAAMKYIQLRQVAANPIATALVPPHTHTTDAKTPHASTTTPGS